jgi:diguanylate cyclase (GGDEF)-like protein
MVDRNKALMAVLIFATMALLCLSVFLHDARWTLLAPPMFAVFAAIWVDALVATAMPLVVAMIAAPLTATGHGPIAPGIMVAADRLQLGLLYAGLVACCSLPVVVERARRRQEIARLSRSAAHFKAMSQEADNLIDELRRAALTDPLTGLPNRRAFFDCLDAHAKSDEPACLAMIDMDYFKQVNDRYGHTAGDSVLCEFAEIARTTFRVSDMVARIGGEEFAVILRGATIEQGSQVVQRLVDRLAATQMKTAAGTVCVTISSGIAVIDDDGHAAMIRADEALYAAKRGGRSRLALAA